MTDEMPLFFLHDVELLVPFVSSELRFDVEKLLSVSEGIVVIDFSPIEKLDEWRIDGLASFA